MRTFAMKTLFILSALATFLLVDSLLLGTLSLLGAIALLPAAVLLTGRLYKKTQAAPAKRRAFTVVSTRTGNPRPTHTPYPGKHAA